MLSYYNNRYGTIHVLHGCFPHNTIPIFKQTFEIQLKFSMKVKEKSKMTLTLLPAH